MKVTRKALVIAVLGGMAHSAAAEPRPDVEKSTLHGINLAPATAPAEEFGLPRPAPAPASPAPVAAEVQAEPVARREQVAAPAASGPARVSAPVQRRAKPKATPAKAAPRAKWVSPWRRAFIKRWGHEPPVPAGAPHARGKAGRE